MTQPAASEIRVGAVLQDTYEITSLIGKGGMGEVFLARHRRLPGRQVAVKVLQNSASLNPELYARFRREAEIATQLGHPNIVEVFDFDALRDGTPFLIMEYLRGESLEHRLQRGPLPLNEALAITRQIGSALQAAHRAGVVHRDLKPANVFLVPTDSGGVVGERVKLLDFGISKMLDSQTLQTQEAVLIGTPQYMAPEQALGKNSEIDARTDLFALGCIVYEMLSGMPPFAGEGGSIVQVIFRIVHTAPEPLATRCPDLPEQVLTAVERALAKSPQDRYPDVASFIGELTGSPLQSLAGTAPPPSFSRAVPPSAEEGGFAATHVPSSTARFPASAPAAGAVDDGLAATHVPSSTARFPAPAPGAAADDVGFAATLVPSSTARIPAPAADDVGFAATHVPSSTARIPAPVAAPPPASPTPTSPPQAVVPPPAAPELRRARAKPIIPMALGAVAVILGVAVVNGWFGARSTPVSASSAPEVVVAPTAPPPPETKVPPAPPAPPEAGPQVPVATPATPAAPAVVASKPTPKPVRQGQREVIPEEVRKDLEKGERELEAGQFREAIRLALKSLRTQKTQAAVSLLARAYCQRGDLSNTKAQWRLLSSAKQRQVTEYCKKYGMDL
jgi:serine/threonine-protein kinase